MSPSSAFSFFELLWVFRRNTPITNNWENHRKYFLKHSLTSSASVFVREVSGERLGPP